jgi:quinol monooxygenase YgiN
MSQPKCRVIAIFQPNTESYEEVKQILLEITPLVYLEAGCEEYDLHETVDGRLIQIETWTTRDLWISHGDQENVARIRAGIAGKLKQDVEVIEIYAAS